MADDKTLRDCTEAKMRVSVGVKLHHPKLPSLYAQAKGLQTEYKKIHLSASPTSIYVTSLWSLASLPLASFFFSHDCSNQLSR